MSCDFWSFISFGKFEIQKGPWGSGASWRIARWFTYSVFQTKILVYTVKQVTGLVFLILIWMNTHGISIVAGYFMTVFQAKTWYRITFNLKPHEFKIFRSWTYFSSLLFQRSTKHIWPLWWYDDDDDWFASLWWEHRNILENCAIKLCWGETSSKLCIVVKTELSLLCGLATAK